MILKQHKATTRTMAEANTAQAEGRVPSTTVLAPCCADLAASIADLATTTIATSSPKKLHALLPSPNSPASRLANRMMINPGGPMVTEQKCLVVVGALPKHFRGLEKKLANRGFDAVHWQRDTERTSLPSFTAAIMVCYDASSMSQKAQAYAFGERWGVPVLSGSAYNWSNWATQLDAQKIVSNVPPIPTRKTVMEVALDYGEAKKAKKLAADQSASTMSEPTTTKEVPVTVTHMAVPLSNNTPVQIARSSVAIRAIYLDWIREAMSADGQISNKELAVMLTARCIEKFGKCATVNFSDKMFTEVRRELHLQNQYVQCDLQTMEEKRAAIEKLQAPVVEQTTEPLEESYLLTAYALMKRNMPDSNVLDPLPNNGPIQTALGGSIAAKFQAPSWPTQDFRDAIEILRREMTLLGVTEVTLTAEKCEVTRVVIERSFL